MLGCGHPLQAESQVKQVPLRNDGLGQRLNGLMLCGGGLASHRLGDEGWWLRDRGHCNAALSPFRFPPEQPKQAAGEYAAASDEGQDNAQD